MGGFSDDAENRLLLLLFNNTAYALIGDTAGLRATTTAGSLYLSLHTADPGDAGTVQTSEIVYTGYARIAVARSNVGWTVTGNIVSPAATISFPAGTGGTGTATHFAISYVASGAGNFICAGTITPNIVCGNGVTPQLTTATALTLD